jgi:hypothetical protein
MNLMLQKALQRYLMRSRLFLRLKVELCVPLGKFGRSNENFLKWLLQTVGKKASTEVAVNSTAIARILDVTPVTYPAAAEMP